MEEQVQITKTETTSGLTIRDLFYKYIRFLPLFIISIALCLFVAYVYLRYATLIYSSSATLVVQDDKNLNNNSNDQFEQLFQSSSKKNIQNEIEYLKSGQLMRRVVTSLNLNYTYLAVGNIKKNVNVYKSLPFSVETFEIKDSSSSFTLAIHFDNNSNFHVNESAPMTFGQVFKNDFGVFRLNKNGNGSPNADYKIIWQPTSTVAASLSSIAIVPKPNTGILSLTYESTNPVYVSDVVNQVMAEYQKATIEDKRTSNQSRLIFIEKERDTVERQIDSINNVLLEFMKRNRLFDTEVQSSGYFAQLEKTKDQVKQQRILLDNVYQIESYVRNKKGDVPVPSSLGLEDPTLNQMVSTYNQAQIELEALKKAAPKGNAVIRQREDVINRLQRNIIESLGNVKTSFNSAISSLQNLTGSVESQLNLMPEKQKELTEIRRQLESKLDIDKTLLEEKERAAIAIAATISDIKVLNEAVPNYAPIKPNRRNIQLLSIAIGLLLPALFIFVLEVLNDKVTSRHDIERITQATIIGEVGHSYGKSNLVVTSHSRSVVAEQFRIIRSNLQYVLNHIHKPVILVTSSFSGEGKSFVSVNIGAVMALAGKRTIILEFDIRKPKILSQLNMPKRSGLTNYLLGKTALEELPVRVDGTENLYVLPCGPVPPNPSELLLDPKLNELFEYLRSNFDCVIMDTAPVGMVSDALTLSRFSDATLYIVRQGHTFKKQIGLVDEFYTAGKLPKISLILNDVKVRTGYGYYGYGRYGYGYGYGSGYFDDETPPPTLLSKWFGWMDIKKWNRKKGKRTKVS